MNILKSLALGALALGVASHAEAQMRISGSTAFRSNMHTAISAQFVPGTLRIAHTGASLSGSRNVIFQGTLASDNVTVFTVQTAWSGSEAGIKAVAGPDASNLLTFLPVGSLPGSGTRANVPTGEVNESANANVAMSDAFQAASIYRGIFQTVTYQTLVAANVAGGVGQRPLGVVPFKFIATTGAPFTSITAQQARSLFSTGFLPLSMLTGNTADQDGVVYAIGRDPDSGTRLTALAETGLGAQAVVSQYEPKIGGARILASRTVVAGDRFDSAQNLWPAGTVNGISVIEGNGGYPSGGDLAIATRYLPPVGEKTYYVTYAGTNDADPNITNATQPATELSFNGATLGLAVGGSYRNNTVLTEGRYTFWSYQHMLYRSTLASSAPAVKAFADACATNIYNVSASIFISDMKVQRTSDGGLVTSTLF